MTVHDETTRYSRPYPAAAPAAAPPAARPAPTDGLAVAGLLTSVPLPPLGLALGIAAHRRIRRTGDRGSGTATAAVVVGAVLTAVWTLLTLVVLVGVAAGPRPVVTPAVPAAPTAPAPPAAPAPAASGASVSPGQVADEIATAAHLPAGSITCPQALPARVGATTTCVASPPGFRPTPVRVTVTSVAGEDVKFDFASQ